MVVFVLVIGCGASSPRFASGEKDAKQSEKQKKGNIRFSSKVIEEETREDDKKVNVKEVQQRFSSAKSTKKTAAPKKNETGEKQSLPSPPVTAENFEQQKMMDAILAWMGTAYEYGGESKSGTDCSGFTMQIFKESAGMQLPRATEEQVKLGSAVAQENLKFGDLIFFNTTGENPSHVGIYIGDNMFAHASVSFGVTLSSLYSSYYKKRYSEARRVVQ